MYKTSEANRKRHLDVQAEPKVKSMHILKVKVHLPAEIDLYPTQKSMIVNILKALNAKENVLLESPTGTGKTLALLTSTCSWLMDYNEKKRTSMEQCLVHNAPPIETTNLDSTMKSEDESKMDISTSFIDNSIDAETSKMNASDAEIETFKPKNECTCKPKIRIYYCSRTHKQIGQVVKEYKRLPFWLHDTIKHTILASREQSCINEDVRGMDGDLNANCRKVLEPKSAGCVYRDALKSFTSGKDRFTMRTRMSDANLEVWDIEELITALPKAKLNVCPYYLTNIELTKDANLIFLPYNYLLDPIIRDSSDVYLKNSIIILDEAHNIEDICRNAASFEFTDFDLAFALHNLSQKINDVEKSPHKNDITNEYQANMEQWHSYIKNFYAVFAKLAKESEDTTPDKFTGVRSKNMSWQQLQNFLNDVYLSIDSDEFKSHLRAFNGLVFKNDADKSIIDQISELNLRLNSNTIVCIEKFIMFFKFHSQADNQKLYKGNLAISQKESQHQAEDTNYEAPKGILPGYTCQLNLWAMLPSTAFNEAFSESYSVILASGTLTPFNTFAGELGVQFKHQMEGRQIIEKERIFAAGLSVGPTNKNLTLTYSNMNDSMMKELAQIIFDVCVVVPKGVLVFVSSYRVLQNIRNALYTSGLHKQLQKIKEIFYEPKGSKEMNEVLSQYEKSIKIPKRGCNGALMIAVFRGKVSEGLDFADDKARAVLTIGIPYASIGDQNVLQKRAFNDSNSKNMGIVTGSEWYEVQAYRALNQALGRCLRHKNDWGALIMVDARYNPNQQKISGWVREQMKVGMPYKVFQNELQQFIDFRLSQQEDIVLEDEEENYEPPPIRNPVNRQFKNPVFN